jgi:hypothetical protein
MRAYLDTQGYRLPAPEAAKLSVGLRFSTGLCLALVVTALAFQSVPMLVALSGIGLVAGFTPRHPFDLLWNRAVRNLLGAPGLVLVAVCALVTTTNYCIPSTLLEAWESRHQWRVTA